MPDFQPSKKSVARLFGLLDACPEGKIPPGEISVAFLGDEAIAALHQQFLGDPSPTDVITFPGDSTPCGTGEEAPENGIAQSPRKNDINPDATPPAFAGEICLCVPQARREAARHGNSVQQEILLYLVHGWLHLAGLDDHDDADIAKMRAAEKSVLRWLATQGFQPAWSA
ncbi:MAG: rRNA maturation RNase YbeY [Puniceicoccales bacterium]|nr:rRNA maturation RNase YbeY [Puniceicoccales bacterium]